MLRKGETGLRSIDIGLKQIREGMKNVLKACYLQLLKGSPLKGLWQHLMCQKNMSTDTKEYQDNEEMIRVFAYRCQELEQHIMELQAQQEHVTSMFYEAMDKRTQFKRNK